MVNLNDAASI